MSTKRRKTDASGGYSTTPSLSNTLPQMDKEMDTIKETSAPAQVYESPIRLLPPSNCREFHGKGKGRLRPEQDPDDPGVYDCGHYADCDEEIVFPASARQQDYRLTTNDPIHDLKRWLITPNQRVSGEECIPRSEGARYFINDSRFLEAHFRECILWAVEEIKCRHNEIHVQIAYFAASPYTRVFHQNPIVSAFPLSALPTLQTMEEKTRVELTEMMQEMAIELDYLGEQACFIRREILGVKWDTAKRGHWGEIADLLNSGWVDVELVQEECDV